MQILWNRNVYLGLLHLFSGVAGFALGRNVGNMKDFTIPLSTIFLDWDTEARTAS